MGTTQSNQQMGPVMKQTKLGRLFVGNILERKIQLTDQQAIKFQNFIKIKESQLDQPIFLKLKGYMKDDEGMFCSSNTVIKIYTEYCETDLQNEIRKRRIASQYFNGQQLIDDIKQLLDALEQYQKLNIEYNLSTSTLLYDTKLRIMDPFIFDLKTPSLPYYRDPTMESYSTWSFGIIIFEMTQLTFMNNLIDIDGSFNGQYFNSNLNKITDQFLKTCLQMIFCNSTRPNFIKLKQQLQYVNIPQNIIFPTHFSIQEQSKFQEVMQQQQQILKTQPNQYNQTIPPLVTQQLNTIPMAQSNFILINNTNRTEYKKENITPITSARSNNHSVLQEKIEQIRATYFKQKEIQQQASTQYLYRQSPQPKQSKQQSETSSTGSEGLFNNSLQIDLQSDPFCQERESDVNTLSKQFNFQQNEEYICETYIDGSIYEGFKKKQKKNGQGSLYYSDGGFYIGQWQNDVMNGFGSLYYPSGKLAYQGGWVNGKFQGKGMLFNECPQDCYTINYEDFDQLGNQWISYSGDFIQDKKQGKGVLIFTNGDRFEGHFKDNMINGAGTFKSDTKVISSIWSMNVIM